MNTIKQEGIRGYGGLWFHKWGSDSGLKKNDLSGLNIISLALEI